MGRVDGKVAIISGGARGMGASHARVLVREGAKVVIGDLLDEEGEALAKELGDDATFVHLDVTRPEEVSNLVLFLASDESSYSTGSEFVIDGGLISHVPQGSEG